MNGRWSTKGDRRRARQERLQRLRQRVRKMRGFPLVPTVVTMANGVCGLLAIAIVTDPSRDLLERLVHAGWLIFLGMAFDVADGHVARITKQTSSFGMQLDSLCDLVTFGAAPAFLVMQFNQVLPKRFLFGIAASYFIASALRLARFNAEKPPGAKTIYFSGLPTPLAAGAIASCAIAFPGLHPLTESNHETIRSLGRHLIEASMIAVPTLSAVLAWLMISRIRYPHIGRQLARRRSFSRVAELILAGVVVATIHELAMPLLFAYCVLVPILASFHPKHRAAAEALQELPAEDEEPIGEDHLRHS